MKRIIWFLIMLVGCATDEPTTPPCSAVVPAGSVKPYPLTCNEGGLCVYTPTSEECCVQVGGVDRAHPDAKPDAKCEGVF